MIKKDPGILYIVATPIGNLKDITLRALDVLKEVDCIVAEDTRHSQPLLRNYSITTPMLALHEHNERAFTQALLDRLLAGESMALISDAGTPLICDPGFFLVREARKQGIKVSPLPGACAAIAALSASGLPTDKFSFEGFLPAKEAARKLKLEGLAEEVRTMVFYEAPHRIAATLVSMAAVWGGDRRATIAREVTKLFETITSASLVELVEFVTSDTNQERGEIVLMVEGKPDNVTIAPDYEQLLIQLLANLPLKQAVDIVTKFSGQKKNSIYQLALTLQKDK